MYKNITRRHVSHESALYVDSQIIFIYIIMECKVFKYNKNSKTLKPMWTPICYFLTPMRFVICFSLKNMFYMNLFRQLLGKYAGR